MNKKPEQCEYCDNRDQCDLYQMYLQSIECEYCEHREYCEDRPDIKFCR